MKIVKDNYSKTKILVTCKHCCSIFKITPKDMFYVEYNDNAHFRCPLCNYGSIVEKPYKVKRKEEE